MTKEGMQPEFEKYNQELTVAIQAVRAAGNAILEQVNNHQAEWDGFEFKAEVDKITDEEGIKVIKTAFPQDAVLTEESGIPKELSKRLWVADFLDGTTNFLNGSRNYSVLLSFVENGRLVVGVSFLPVSNELFCAVEDEGAYVNGKRICVSAVDELKRSTIALDPGYDPEAGKKVSDLFLKLRPQSGNVAMYNSNGYTLSMVAKGELAGFVHFFSKVWEAAGFILVKEAGGRVTDIKGKDLKLDFTSSEGFAFVASNGLIHNELLQVAAK